EEAARERVGKEAAVLGPTRFQGAKKRHELRSATGTPPLHQRLPPWPGRTGNERAHDRPGSARPSTPDSTSVAVADRAATARAARPGAVAPEFGAGAFARRAFGPGLAGACRGGAFGGEIHCAPTSGSASVGNMARKARQ